MAAEFDQRYTEYQLGFLETSQYNTFIVSHFLVHLDSPNEASRQMVSSCHRLGIRRVIVVVPGPMGFRYDKTHRTFIDRTYLQQNNQFGLPGYAISTMKYYPFNAAWAGEYFTHNELVVVYDRQD